jgi:hypothetical protein
VEFEQNHDLTDEVPEQTQLPTDSSGQLRLTDWAIGVVDDDSLARDCAQVLEEEGIAARDICIVPGATALQQLRQAQQLERDKRPLGRMRDAVGDAIREGEPVRNDLEAEAHAGHTFVGIHVPDSDQMDDIRNILEEHQIHHLYLFEPTMITRLA